MELEPDQFDMWEFFKIPYGGYNSEIDRIFIEVLKSQFDYAGNSYADDIAKRCDCCPLLIELIQYIICSTNLWDYGTYPRGCWPNDDNKCKDIIVKCEDYYKRKWIDKE